MSQVNNSKQEHNIYYHITKSGVKMRPDQMKLTHLQNTIRSIYTNVMRNLKESGPFLENGPYSNDELLQSCIYHEMEFRGYSHYCEVVVAKYGEVPAYCEQDFYEMAKDIVHQNMISLNDIVHRLHEKALTESSQPFLSQTKKET